MEWGSQITEWPSLSLAHSQLVEMKMFFINQRKLTSGLTVWNIKIEHKPEETKVSGANDTLAGSSPSAGITKIPEQM